MRDLAGMCVAAALDTAKKPFRSATWPATMSVRCDAQGRVRYTYLSDNRTTFGLCDTRRPKCRYSLLSRNRTTFSRPTTGALHEQHSPGDPASDDLRPGSNEAIEDLNSASAASRAPLRPKTLGRPLAPEAHHSPR